MPWYNILPFYEDPFDLSANPDGLTSLLPACYGDGLVGPTGDINMWSPVENPLTFIQLDLSVERLTRIWKYLWFTKSLSPPQPLSTIISLSREIILDENIIMHLVWADRKHIHLKPLPRYLLASRFWSTYIICNGTCPQSCTNSQAETALDPETTLQATSSSSPACPHSSLYKDALGFLSSYLTLIRFESDFAIAQAHSLLPPDLRWETWRSIAQQTLASGAMHHRDSINPRYHLGALRLSRLNTIHALRYGDLLRGYLGQHKSTVELFSENAAPITAMTVYVALVLTAMQVGLATEALAGNRAFQNASYGFTVFAILGPLVLIALIYCVGAAEVLSTRVFHALRARYARRVARLDEVDAQRDFLREVRGE